MQHYYLHPDLLGLDLFLVLMTLLKSHFMLWVRQKMQSCPNTMFCILQIFVSPLLFSPRSFLLQIIDGASLSISCFQYLWSQLWEVECKIQKSVWIPDLYLQAAVCRQYVITVLMNVVWRSTFILPDETFSARYVRDFTNSSGYQRSLQWEEKWPKNKYTFHVAFSWLPV